MKTLLTLCAAAGISLSATAAMADDHKNDGPVTAEASIINRQGNEIGVASFTEAPGGVLVEAEIVGLPEGWHAFHIHETGTCEGDFTSAGGHAHGADGTHGFLVEGGPGLGDMPNQWVDAGGFLKTEAFAPDAKLSGDGENNLLAGDGSALILHQGADDYTSQPSGAAGPRIACGVLEPVTD